MIYAHSRIAWAGPEQRTLYLRVFTNCREHQAPTWCDIENRRRGDFALEQLNALWVASSSLIQQRDFFVSSFPTLLLLNDDRIHSHANILLEIPALRYNRHLSFWPRACSWCQVDRLTKMVHYGCKNSTIFDRNPFGEIYIPQLSQLFSRVRWWGWVLHQINLRPILHLFLHLSTLNFDVAKCEWAAWMLWSLLNT